MNCPICGEEITDYECVCGVKFGESIHDPHPLSDFVLEIKLDKALRECKRLGIDRDEILKYGVDRSLELLNEIDINSRYRKLNRDINDNK